MFITALSRRTDRTPTVPLITHYDGESRVELSVATFANWVDKTCLLLEELDVEPGEAVQLDLVRTDPGHWVTWVWVAAAWQRGCHAVTQADGVVRVTGPGGVAAPVPTVVCSLHPLGLALPAVPDGCLDYADVLAQPDLHTSHPVGISEPAFDELTHADVAAVTPSDTRRLLVDPAPGWDTIAVGLVAPVLGQGSSVVATGVSEAALQRIRSEEKVA